MDGQMMQIAIERLLVNGELLSDKEKRVPRINDGHRKQLISFSYHWTGTEIGLARLGNFDNSYKQYPVDAGGRGNRGIP